MDFYNLVHHLLDEAKDSHMGNKFAINDVVQLKHAQLSSQSLPRIYKDYQPGDKFTVIGREEGVGSMRKFIVKPIDQEKIYKVFGYHIQDANIPLQKVIRVPKRLKGEIVCSNCKKTFSLELPGSKHRDHCPYCLCSVHIDVRPGDRGIWCGEGEVGSSEFKHSILRPIAINKDQPYILYKCDKCGKTKVNVQAFDDNPQILQQLPIKDFKVRGYKI